MIVKVLSQNWGKSFLLKETMGGFDGDLTHDWLIMSQMRYPLHHIATHCSINLSVCVMLLLPVCTNVKQLQFLLNSGWTNTDLMYKEDTPGLDFIITDLPSVLILMIADQIWNHSLCCSYKYNWCLCRVIGKLEILLLTLLIILSDICIILLEIFWIKL